MNPETEQIAHRIAGALFNGMYQGLALALMLWMGLKLFRGINAATRHAVAFVALLLVAALPLPHFLSTQKNRDADRPAAAPADDRGTVAHAVQSFQDNGEVNVNAALTPTVVNPAPESPAPRNWIAKKPPGQATDSAGEAFPPMDLGRNAAATTQPEPIGPSLKDSITDLSRWLIRDRTASLPGAVSILIVAAIGLIGGARLLRLMILFFGLSRLKRTGVEPDNEIAGMFSRVVTESPIRRPVRVGVSDRIHAPMAVGYFKPMVLLPADLVAAAEAHELESVLRHELAHIQRRDDWFNLVQQLIGAIAFFNPAVWWLSNRITVDREIACDDHALSKSRSPQDYALLLTEFAGRSRGRDWIAAPAAWNSQSQLKERVNMILDSKRNTSSHLARTSAATLTVATIAAAAAAVFAGPRLVLAAPADQPAVAATSTSAAAPDSVETAFDNKIKPHIGSGIPFGDAQSTSAEPAAPRIKSRAASSLNTLTFGNASAAAPAAVIAPVEATVEMVEVRPQIAAEPLAPLLGIPVNIRPPHPARPEDPGIVQPPETPLPLESRQNALASKREQESLERRLDRLERQIERLTAGQKGHGEFSRDPSFANDEFELHGKSLKREPKAKAGDLDLDLGAAPGTHHENANQHPDWEIPEVHQEVIEKAIQRAHTEMERAMKGADRAMRERARHTDLSRAEERVAEHHARFQRRTPRETAATDVSLDQQRNRLDAQKRLLEDQMKSLDRQIEELHEQFHRLEAQRDRLDTQRARLDRQTDVFDETGGGFDDPFLDVLEVDENRFGGQPRAPREKDVQGNR